MVPWPYRLSPGGQTLTFRGYGNAATGEFALNQDAALRMVWEAGPFRLRVRRADGAFLPQVAEDSDGGFGLMGINHEGTYSLVIETPARWGVTVVIHPSTRESP